MAKTYDPWTDLRQIRLPKAERGAEDSRFVGVNGRYFQVPLGKTTEVPKPVYDVLMDAAASEDEADAYIETILSR